MIHLISSFHYDVIHLKASEPYRKTGFEIIDRALELLVQEPDYRFNVEQVILLEGLHGFIQDSEEELDWARIAALYQAARQDIPEDVQQHLQQ